jgi:hypothetical protein
MRYSILTLALLFGSVPSARAQVSVGVGIAVPGINIGIEMPAYPEMVPVPGYPVYYAPGANTNYFFYDGLYWVYARDGWYASSWYNGPWRMVAPDRVPLYVLRVPVRYYRAPPPYFRGWHGDHPPRWGEHWGRDWEHRHRGWDRWNRRAAPAPAPLPVYQGRYGGDRYPHAQAQQHRIRAENYRHSPRESYTRQEFRPPPRAVPARPEPRRPQADRPGEGGREHGRGKGGQRGERGEGHGEGRH